MTNPNTPKDNGRADTAKLVDALCRLKLGWSSDIPGDKEDFDAAHRLVSDRYDNVRGTFAPSRERQLEAAVKAALSAMAEPDLGKMEVILRAALIPPEAQ